jgi:Tol biopolymer transport system component
MMALSPDGSHAYFVAKGVLTDTQNALGEEAVEGAPNVYLYEHDEAHPQGRLSFVTRLAPSDFSDWQEGANGQGIGLPNITPDGRFILFTSHRALIPGAVSGAAQVYRYDAAGEAMTRVSIGQRGFNDDGNSAQLDATIVRARSEIDNNIGPPKANPSISNDGRFVFFQSPVGLTPGALNEVKVSSGETTEYAENVYEWEQDGAGGCHEASGCVSLLTDGTEASEGGVVLIYNPELLGTDASGENVFIAAIHQLTWQDTDTQRDYYDLRVSGGFPRPEEALPCQGDVCKGEGTKPGAAPSPATPNFSGPEEGPRHPQKLKKSKHKKKQHKKKQHKKKQHRKSNRTGGKK